jgi:protein O-GlcNAc transferase
MDGVKDQGRVPLQGEEIVLVQARDIIAEAKLDILFYPDIGMDPLTYFLGFARLARTQCVGWGHGVSTGLDTIDYFISSTALEEPENAQSHYTENLVRLSQPPTYMYRPQTPPAESGPDLSFAGSGAIYTCPQTLFKILPEFDNLLMRILERDPTGRAVFIDGLPGWSDALMRRWRNLNAKAAERIHFVPRQDQNDFLALLRDSTLILDTVHFSGGVSSAEALAQGTPIVTWPESPLLVGRAAFAYLQEIEVTETVATSAEDYVDKAVRLGTDPAWRNQVAAKIRAQNHLLFERQDVIEELEIFFERAFKRPSSAWSKKISEPPAPR